MYIRVRRVVYPLRVPRVIRVFIDLLLSVSHLKGMGVYLSLLCHTAGVRGDLEQFAIFQINEVYIGREIQLYYLFC